MTYEFGDKTKPKLVILHGYLACAMLFFRMFKYLENDFHIILIDNLGWGASSRPKFLGRNYEDAIEFFLQIFEKWRIKMNITDFYLVGHSLGAYIWTKYTLRYPQHVRKLALLSPLGVESAPDNPKQYILERVPVWSFVKPMLWKIFKTSSENQFNYLDFIRLGGRALFGLASLFIFNRIIRPLNRRETNAYINLKTQLVMASESTEVVITYLMENYIMPYEPILHDLDTLKKLGIEVSFSYGNDRDFLQTDFDQSGVRISDKLKEMGLDSHSIENAEHNLGLHEPEEVARLLKAFLLGEN